MSRANDVTWMMTSRGPAVRPPAKLTRKMSVDCLLDRYNDSIDGHVDAINTLTTHQPAARPLTLSRRSPSGYFTGNGCSMTPYRSASVDSCGFRNVSRPPLQLRTDLFRAYPSSVPATSAVTTAASATSALDGLLSVHVYCGRGLTSAGSRAAAMQELYCVVAVDGVSRARTGVTWGATNLDWDDRFVVDVRSASALSFGVYSFDRSARRHRLCFTASLSLPTVFRRGGSGGEEEDGDVKHCTMTSACTFAVPGRR